MDSLGGWLPPDGGVRSPPWSEPSPSLLLREGRPEEEALAVGAMRSFWGIVMAIEGEVSVAVDAQPVVASWVLCCGPILKVGGGTG